MNKVSLEIVQYCEENGLDTNLSLISYIEGTDRVHRYFETALQYSFLVNRENVRYLRKAFVFLRYSAKIVIDQQYMKGSFFKHCDFIMEQFFHFTFPGAFYYCGRFIVFKSV
jgi:hypothetical protein